MILNAKDNNFRVEFPRGYFYKEVCDKYEPIIKRMPIPYDNLRDYMNSSIQSITFPSIEGPLVDQLILDDPVTWKGRGNVERWMSRDFTITFKLYEAYLNYWIMFEQLRYFYDYHTKDIALPGITLQFLDNDGYEIIAFLFKQTVFYGISSIELSYGSNVPNFKTFTCSFKYNYPEILHRLD